MSLTDPKQREVAEQIAADVRRKFPTGPGPKKLAAWLDVYTPSIAGAHGQAENEVGAYATAIAYGPLQGLPSAVVLNGIRRMGAFAVPVDRRAVERALVYGLLAGRPNRHGWDGEWDRAWEALYEIVLEFLRTKPSLSRLKSVGLIDLSVEEEAASCAVALTTYLVRGCDCPTSWRQFRIQDACAAGVICRCEHYLSMWLGVDPLADFLEQAIVGPQDFPRVNDFRKHMLAKIAGDTQLVAGYVLKCSRRECSGIGIIGLIDRCMKCGEQSAFPEADTWWMWRQDKLPLVAAYCRRCRVCGCLRFQAHSRCPHCGTVTELRPRSTEVFVPVEPVTSLDLLTNVLSAGVDPARQVADKDQLRRWLEILQKCADCSDKRLLVDLLNAILAGQPTQHFLRERGLDASVLDGALRLLHEEELGHQTADDEFRQWLGEAIPVLFSSALDIPWELEAESTEGGGGSDFNNV